MKSPSPLALSAADSRILVYPNIGGAIARYTWRNIDILRRTADQDIAEKLIRRMSSYPLVPFSNRIGHGKLIVGKETFPLRLNFPPEPHTIHGFGWQREWRVISASAAAIDLQLGHQPDIDWPFACEAGQRFRLEGDALSITLNVRNTDTRPMPAGLGFHPFFPLTEGTHLQAEWSHMWQMSEEKLPTERVVAPPETDYAQLRPLAGWNVDHCFTGWKRRALLDYPTHLVELTASEACSQIVCFAPNDGRAFIALEPVSNINNAFALAARGVPDTGMRLLAPGEAFSVSMKIAPGPHRSRG